LFGYLRVTFYAPFFIILAFGDCYPTPIDDGFGKVLFNGVRGGACAAIASRALQAVAE
jgi:hypothetical protein